MSPASASPPPAAPLEGYCGAARGHPVHEPYHDREYGAPAGDDDTLFEPLVLEINQAGPSWETILRKREGVRKAFDGFCVAVVAGYGAAERTRLRSDGGIVRNRLKVRAVIFNARRILENQASHGSSGAWLDAHHLREPTAWTRLFRETFRFTGGEIIRSFLRSTGYLPGAHVPGCPALERIVALDPPWPRAGAEADAPGSP